VRERRVRALLVLFATTALAGMPYSTLMPIFASRVFHGDARTLGTLMGAAGLGALAGTLTLAARRHLRGTVWWIAMACGTFGATLILFAVSRTLWLSIGILVPLGGALMIQLSATNTLLQTMTPDALRGRVMAIWAMIFMGFAPFGALLAGWLATTIGPSKTLLLGGSVCVGVAILFASWLRSSHAWGEEASVAQSGEDRATAGARRQPHPPAGPSSLRPAAGPSDRETAN
jgi:MFS family permease